MRKVCALIQSLLSCRQNRHSTHRYDREKYHTLLTSIQRVNIVHDITNVEQNELFGVDAGRSLPDMAEAVQSRFFLVTAAAEAIGHICQTCFECPVGKRQRIPCKPPGERELGVIQVAELGAQFH